MQRHSQVKSQILEEASEWFVTFRDGQASDQEREEFAAWLRASPEHVRAYLEISAIWAGVRAIDPQKPEFDVDALIARAAGGDNVVAFGERASQSIAVPPSTSAGQQSRKGRDFMRPNALFAAGMALILIAGGAIWWQLVRGTYSTDIGEQRSLQLADGSVAELNSRSTVRVRFTDAERAVELLEGQALFRVARDVERPFVVTSDTARVRAVGTAFDVYQRASGTRVTVLEGKVEIRTNTAESAETRKDGDEGATRTPASTADTGAEAPPGRPGRALALTAGEQAVVRASRVERSARPNLAAATAWTQRQIVFESASLEEVAEEFNRYNARQIEIETDVQDEFRITGVFSSADPASLLRFLRAQPGVRVQEEGDVIRIDRLGVIE